MSYEAPFLFCAAVNLAAAIGLWIKLPDGRGTTRTTTGNPLAVLRRSKVWLSIATAVCVFAAMFSVYSYAAEYLARQAQLDGEAISLLLGVFGVGGVLGNLLAGRALDRKLGWTVLAYPALLAAAYALLLRFASPALAGMLPICLLWGAAHASGLIVSQMWMSSAAPEAPEFATSLYVSAANLGVVLGAALGGSLIGALGISGIIWSGWLFAALAAVTVLARKPWQAARTA